ncbi:MAG: aminomethyl-transferring glycine dehydrogenase subunit GcvPB [Planctomycetes bacterium]|nr:aminomethyl-transferring glycine dehydrogenase subunit GcvPB [Planctomycetota bacterium]
MSLLFEKGSPGRSGAYLPAPDPGKGLRDLLPAAHLRPVPPRLPEVDELGVVRHFTELSRLNFSIDGNFYPLGSCTMKYNPRINEEAAALPGFAALHPFQPEEEAQGSLELMHLLERHLAEIGGMDATTLQPAAGAQGELTGLMLIKAHHKDRGEPGRTEVLIPDSAHGTNPASCTLCGYKTVTVKSTSDGGVDLDDLKRKLGAKTAAMMITNPSTLGLFEERIEEIAAIVHGAGAQMYMDGANMNALLGRARPGDFGIDVMHFNLHKTFSTPHGGGGPGSGPVACRKHLEPYLPVPRIVRDGERFRFDSTHPKSIGRVKSFWGNHGMHVRAYAYIRHHGAEGLRQVSAGAVLNANYLLARMRGAYQIPYDRTCMHEFVLSGNRQKKQGLRTLDIAKRLLDFGFHPPTIYFPLIVPECLMIEPTETENRETLDAFADAMLRIAEECKSDPEKVHRAPHTMPVKRLDEVRAAKQPVLRWHPPPPAER